MSSDPKRHGKRPKQKAFNGNSWTKRAKGDAEVTDSSSEDAEPCASIQQEGSSLTESPSAMPTRTEVKLQNLYDIMKDSSDESSSSDKEETDDEKVIQNQEGEELQVTEEQ